jgi:hypothetical protein
MKHYFGARRRLSTLLLCVLVAYAESDIFIRGARARTILLMNSGGLPELIVEAPEARRKLAGGASPRLPVENDDCAPIGAPDQSRANRGSGVLSGRIDGMGRYRRLPPPANFRRASGAQKSVSTSTPADVADRVRLITDEVIAASYPELRDTDIRIKLFRSESDYFRARFSFRRFFFHRKMRYYILANSKLVERQAPENGIRAIIAHELGHILYFKRRNRIELLGLVRLLSKDFTIHFEKWADLQAISRGYGDGLKEYREWLYLHIPAKKMAEKRRNYYSPEEIDHLASVLQKHPEKLADWLKDVPKKPLDEIGNE